LGFLSWILIFPSRIPDPRVQKAPDPQHEIGPKKFYFIFYQKNCYRYSAFKKYDPVSLFRIRNFSIPDPGVRKAPDLDLTAYLQASTPTDGRGTAPPHLAATMMRTPDNPPPKRTALTTLPRPLFLEEPETFSTKKERRGREGGGEGAGGRSGPAWPYFKPPPRPPAKSCPPKR
jgi:hypothetical protein